MDVVGLYVRARMGYHYPEPPSSRQPSRLGEVSRRLEGAGGRPISGRPGIESGEFGLGFKVPYYLKVDWT